MGASVCLGCGGRVVAGLVAQRLVLWDALVVVRCCGSCRSWPAELGPELLGELGLTSLSWRPHLNPPYACAPPVPEGRVVRRCRRGCVVRLQPPQNPGAVVVK